MPLVDHDPVSHLYGGDRSEPLAVLLGEIDGGVEAEVPVDDPGTAAALGGTYCDERRCSAVQGNAVVTAPEIGGRRDTWAASLCWSQPLFPAHAEGTCGRGTRSPRARVTGSIPLRPIRLPSERAAPLRRERRWLKGLRLCVYGLG